MPEKILGVVADADRLINRIAEGKSHSKVSSVQNAIFVCYKTRLEDFMPACDPIFFPKDVSAKVRSGSFVMMVKTDI